MKLSEKYVLPSYFLGTEEERNNYYDMKFGVDAILKKAKNRSNMFPSDEYIEVLPWIQIFASAITLIIGKETGSGIYTGLGGCLGADYLCRFVKAIADDCNNGIAHQSGLIGTVRGLYGKLKK